MTGRPSRAFYWTTDGIMAVCIVLASMVFGSQFSSDGTVAGLMVGIGAAMFFVGTVHRRPGER